jgi:leader peptidase (prepilin peptidase)/N-methyltransferase
MVCFGGLGMLAGVAARLLIGRLPRGASVPPPWCELAVGVLWAAAGGWWASGRLPVELLPLLLGVGWFGVAAGAVDLVCRRLPDALTLPALPAALLVTAPLGAAAAGRAVLGATVLFGAHLVVRVLAPAALGAGDVKLAAVLGAVLGAVSWPALVVGVVLAGGTTAVVAAVGLLSGRMGIGAAVPHGPAMLAAGWAVVAAAGLGAAGATAWPA